MFYTADIEYYEIVDDTSNKISTFVSANSYKEAIEELAAYFGEKEIESISIAPFSPDNLLIFEEGNHELFLQVKSRLGKDIIW